MRDRMTESAVLASYACRVLALLDDRAPAEDFDALAAAAREQGTVAEEVERASRLGLSIRAALDRSERREAGLSALVDTGRELALQDSLDALLRAAVRRVRLVFRVDMAYVSLADEHRTAISVQAADGHSTPFSARDLVPLDASNHAVFLSPHPLCTSDYLADERAVRDPRMDGFVRAEGLRALMAVPLRCGGEPFGTLHAAHRRVRHFGTDERAMMTALGELVGVAVERARRADAAASRIAGLERSLTVTLSDLHAARELAARADRLTDLVLAGSSLHELVAEADRGAGVSVAVCSPTGELLAASATTPPEEEWVAAARAVETGGRPRDGIRAEPVLAGGARLGTLLVRPRTGGADPALLAPLARAVALLLRTNGTGGGTDRVGDELLEDLLGGERPSDRQLERRARRHGVDLSRPHVVVVAQPVEAGGWCPTDRAEAYARRAGGLAADRADEVVLLVPGTDAGAVARAVLAELSGSATVGAAGPVSGPGGVPTGHEEARRCVRALRAIGAAGRAASARELGFLGVLLSDRHDVPGFLEATLGPLLAHDQDQRTELAATLDAYFEAGGSPLRAAQALHVHPNTVARRLDRIRELMPDWKEPGRALDLQLALRLLRVRDAL